MSAMIALPDRKVSSTNSSEGSSLDQMEISRKAQVTEAYRSKSLPAKSTGFFYLLGSSDLSEFENRVEEIRSLLLEDITVFSEADIARLKTTIDKLDLPYLLAVARLFGPLLENKSYSRKAAFMIKKLLKHHKQEARYTALEAISFALGEVPIADRLLAKAKDILKNETSQFVIDYLESL